MMPMIFWRVGSLDLLGSLLLALDGSTLVLDALLSPLAGGLGLRTLGVHLLLELGLAGGLGLGLVNLWVALGICDLLDQVGDIHTCSTRARLCLKVLPLLRW